jgi:hypothetical protein
MKIKKLALAAGPSIFLLPASTDRERFAAFSDEQGWLTRSEHPSEGLHDAYERIWTTSDGTTAIHYMDDPTPKQRFVVVYGAKAGEVALQLGARFHVETADDVFDRALTADSDAARIDVAWQLAVVNKSFDEPVLDLLKSLYDGADEEVRHAVVNAIGYRGWYEGLAFLQDVAKTDTSRSLVQNTNEIIKAWGSARAQ